MAKSKKRRKQAEKRAKLLTEKKRWRMSADYLTGRGNSLYARKRRWLLNNPVEQDGKLVCLWGWMVPHPKPW